MTHQNYEESLKIGCADLPFYALIHAALLVGEEHEQAKITAAWPRPMSPYEIMVGGDLAKTAPPFQALIMAAIRQADIPNTAKLRAAWPATWEELHRRKHAPLGVLPDMDGFTAQEYHERKSPPPEPPPPTPAEEALSYLEESVELTPQDWEELTTLLNERRST